LTGQQRNQSGKNPSDIGMLQVFEDGLNVKEPEQTRQN